MVDCSSSIESSFDSDSLRKKNSYDSSFSKNSKQSESLPLKTFQETSTHSEIEVDNTATESHADTPDVSILSDNYLTMSGTIQRGRKKGQNVDVILNMSREELEGLDASLRDRKDGKCGVGPHILVFTMLTSPLAAIISAGYSFFVGTLTWYNIFSYFSEEVAIYWKVLAVPPMILMYPFVITVFSIGLGIYSGVWQISWRWRVWVKQFWDFEKGFYGWFCGFIKLPDCSPYDVIVLSGTSDVAS